MLSALLALCDGNPSVAVGHWWGSFCVCFAVSLSEHVLFKILVAIGSMGPEVTRASHNIIKTTGSDLEATRLLHSLNLVTAGLSVGCETWPSIGWCCLARGWLIWIWDGRHIDCTGFWVFSLYVTDGNFHLFQTPLTPTDGPLTRP